MFQVNGVANGLEDLSLTSGDQASRLGSMLENGTSSSSFARSATQPLEAKSIPPQLSNTLEHIVGQLDILTQVSYIFHVQSKSTHYGLETPYGIIPLI